jgi:hypothetical protein
LGGDIDTGSLSLLARAVGLKAGKGIGYVGWHVGREFVGGVVPVDADADIFLTGEVDFDLVLEAEHTDEVIEGIHAGVFDAEVVDNQREGDKVGFVLKEGRYIGILNIVMLAKVGNEVSISDTPGDRMAVHCAVDLEENVVVRGIFVQIEFDHRLSRDVLHCDRDVLGLVELAAEVEVLDVDGCVASIGMVIAAVRDDGKLVGLYHGDIGNWGGHGAVVIASIAA